MSLQLFRFDECAVRISDQSGDPWFVASDLCRALGLAQVTRALDRLDPEDRGVTSIKTPGGWQDCNIVNESGMYSLILASRKPDAKRFKRWVTAEVLPTLRKTGAFSVVPAASFDIPTTLPDALRLAADSIDRAEKAELLLADAAPKLVTYNTVMSADGLFGFREAASLLAVPGLGSNNLVVQLLKDRVLYRDERGKLKAYRSHIEQGRFKAIEKAYQVPGRDDHKISVEIKITQTGIDWLANKYGKGAA